jgi:hypothetical protein
MKIQICRMIFSSVLSLFLIFNSGCSSVAKKTENSALENKEIKKWYSSYPEWPQVMTNYLAYGTSYPLAGAGYMADGAIYVVGYLGAVTIICGPAILLGVAMNNADATIGSAHGLCLLPLDPALENLEKEHPQFGRQIWRATADWRRDPRVIKEEPSIYSSSEFP